MEYHYKNFLLLLLMLAGLPAISMQHQNPKTDADQLVGAAGAGNIKGLNYWIKTQKMNPNTYNTYGRSALGLAAGNGQLEAVNFILNAQANPNIQDITGLTPLHWAVLILNQQKTEQDYIEIIKTLLSKGARLDILDKNDLSILHFAARSGNPTIIKLVLDSDAKRFINHEGSQEKGRTPLQEALRASRDAIIHVDLENKDINNQADFAQALEQAITELKKKEERKLATIEIINVINLLKRYGARTDIADALGHKLDYYINEVQLISEPDRINLLNTLNLPVTPRMIKYQQADLNQAIASLQNLQSMLPALTSKINMIVWTLQAAQREANTVRKYDILRISMALLAKTKELMKTEITDPTFFADIENSLNQVRTIVRDNALIVSQKATPQRAPLAPLTRPTGAQPKISPAVQPTTKPAPAITPAAPPQPQIPEQGFLITDIINQSEEKILIEYFNLDEQQQRNLIIPGAQKWTNPEKVSLNSVVTGINASTSAFSSGFWWHPKKPTIIEEVGKKIQNLDRNKYAASKLIFYKDKVFELVPDTPTQTKQTAPNPAATPPTKGPLIPVTKPAAAQPQSPQAPERGILITRIINASNKPVDFRITFEGAKVIGDTIGAVPPGVPATPYRRIDYNLTRSYVLTITSFNSQRLFEIPNENTTIIEMFDPKTGTFSQVGRVNNFKLSIVEIKPDGSITLQPGI